MQVPPFTLSKQIKSLGKDLDEAVLRILHSGNFIGGSEVKSFEESFAKLIDVPFVVGCNSGTDALILALRALDIGPGDEVITSSFSFFATAEAISSVGSLPVFVDVDPINFLLNIELLEKAITPATKAIIPVHLFGCPVNMDKLMEFSRKHNLKVVEDCAQACGALWRDNSVGSFGDVGCFSFFPTKNLGAAGDAGAVSTRDKLIAQKVRELSVHGMPRRYLHSSLGYNSRLDAIQASVLNIKIPYLSNWVKQRFLIAKNYKDLLNDSQGIISLPSYQEGSKSKHGWNQFVIRVPNSKKNKALLKKFLNDNFPQEDLTEDLSSRDLLKKALKNQNIDTIIYYPIPIHLQPAYKKLGYSKGSLPITERLCNEVLSLPMFPEMTIEEQLYVVESIKKAFQLIA